MLTKEDIYILLEHLSREVVVAPTGSFPYYITKPQGHGYSKDHTIGKIQAKLSIMLEVAK
jgi:hypothetical protein